MKINSKNTYDCILRTYIALVPKDKILTNEGIKLFINKLQDKNYAQSTIRLYYYAVIKSLKSIGVNVSIDPPDIEDDSINRHIYKINEINSLIQVSIELGGLYAKSMVLSTIYGIRRTEIANLDIKNINIEEKVIKIKAAKGGKSVQQLIPDVIVKYLNNNIKFLSTSGMSRIFNEIANSAKVNTKHAGWHSIRRSLVSNLLLNGVPQDVVLGFMRWKTHTMLDIYHIRDPREDLIVLEKHPFIHMWE